MAYTIKDLEKWNDAIEAIAKESGLDYYEQEFEIISYKDMLSYEAYLECLLDILTGALGRPMRKIELCIDITLQDYPTRWLLIRTLPSLPYEGQHLTPSNSYYGPCIWPQ